MLSQIRLRGLLCLLAVVMVTVLLLGRVQEDRLFYQVVRQSPAESETFRAFDLGEYGLREARAFAAGCGQETAEVLAVWMATGNLPLNEERAPLSIANYFFQKACLSFLHADAYERLQGSIESLLADVQCFPVVADEQGGYPDWSFDNSWGGARTYGGERTHEGTDLMGEAQAAVPGACPIVSMTDGVVEAIGWLELGGWRVGIRSPSGTYYYYAHLHSYAQGLAVGDRVMAGQLIGFMGDSGYGKEGTTGQFPVHLHVGIYLTDDGKEYAVNPYWILRDLEHLQLTGAWRP